MRPHIILILLMVNCMSFASTESNNQQKVNPKFKAGIVEIDRNELIRNAGRNVSSYLDYMEWGKKKHAAFMEAYGKIVTAIQKGYISERDHSRNWIDTSGLISNRTGGGFDAAGAVCCYLDTILDELIEQSYYEQMPSAAQEKNSSTSDKKELDKITRILKK